MSNYYRNQPVVTLFDDVTLTGTAADNREIIACGGMEKATLYVNYAMGAAETANLIEITLEGSHDGTNFYVLPIDTTTTTESTITQRHWELSEGLTTFGVELAYTHLRISMIESGVASNAGTATLQVGLSGL